MKIAWLLQVVWLLSWGYNVAPLHFVTDESLDEILEDETHKLTTVHLETSLGAPLNGAAMWSKEYFYLLISCDHGTLQLDQEVERSLVDTAFLCSANDRLQRSIGVFTTAQEAQQILSSIIYQPDANFHSTWYGVTDPLCTTGNVGHEVVYMHLSLLSTYTPQTSQDACLAVDIDDSPKLTKFVSIHRKKISVASVNDAPTIERNPEVTLSVYTGGSCIGLFGFKLGDAEAAAAENDPAALVPILSLELNVQVGKLRVNRRTALQKAIHVVGNAGQNSGPETLAWTLPDLTDNSFIMKGAISDLNDFLPAVEYCSPSDAKVVVNGKLLLTLSDNGFCGGATKANLKTTLEVPLNILPVEDLGELFFTNKKITIANHSASVNVQYSPGTTDEVDCTIELKYNDGLLLGIDYQTNILFKKTKALSLGTSRAPNEVLIPAGGFILRFLGENDKREATRFQFVRRICALDEICHEVESSYLDEKSSDDEILAAAQMLTLVTESITELQVIRYPVSRFWLIWNIPNTFGQSLFVSNQFKVSLQTVGRQFHLQGKSNHVANQLKTLNVYSLLGGIESYNRMSIQLSTIEAGSVGNHSILLTQLDIFTASALENVKLVYPHELILGDSREMSVNNVSLWYPSTYASNTILEWTIQSTLGFIWWDPSSISSAVVSRQISKHEMTLKGDLTDLSAAIFKIRVDFSNIQETNSSFKTFQVDQTYHLRALALPQTFSDIQTTHQFQLRVQNRVTSPLDSCADASTVENAIHSLSIVNLIVSVKREASFVVAGRFDYIIMISAPSSIPLSLVADASSSPLSRALFEASHVSSGSESQMAMDTISMFLNTADNGSLVVSGEMYTRLFRKKKKLGIRLPVSYLQVNSSQALTIEGVDFEGYAQNLNFSVSCSKGMISFLPKQLSQSKPIDMKATLEMSGNFWSLKTLLELNRLIYVPEDGANGYDELIFTILSADDLAVERLPIVIESPLKLPSLTLPVTSMLVVENEFVRIEGAILTHEQDEQQSLSSRGIRLNITTQYGYLEMATMHRDQNLQLSQEIYIEGDIDNVNAALIGLRYQAPAQATEDRIRFSTSWLTESRGQTSPVVFTLPIKITRRPATVKVLFKSSNVGDSSLLTTLMEIPAPLSNLSLEIGGNFQGWSYCNNTVAGSIASECNATVELSLYASHGVLTNQTVPFSEENQFQDSQLELPLVRFIGSVINANRYLQRQIYIPDAQFHGLDQIIITVKHEFLGSEGVTEDTVMLPVYVFPDCEAPRLSWAVTGAHTLEFTSSTRYPFTLPELLLTREGLEKGYCKDDTVFQLILTASQGFLLSESAKSESSDNHFNLPFEGRLWDLNMALKSVEYQFEIHRTTQKPVVASIEAHVYAKTELPTAVTSAFLQLHFVGDIRPPEMLMRETLMVLEDTKLLIGEMINFDAFVDVDNNSTIRINVHNGVVYGASNEVHMEARREQQMSIKSLRSVRSSLQYIPNLNFNGIDEVHFNIEGQNSTLYIYVQPENDLPTFQFNLGEKKDWYKFPQMFLPSFQLVDPDENDMFQVAIRVENGSFIVDQMASSAFDGITMELSPSLSSLRFTSRMYRLNTVFLQRLIEVIPTFCMNDKAMESYCAAVVELCVDDGGGVVCEELEIPEHDLFYHITVPNWAQTLSISAGTSLDISQAFEVHQRFDVVHVLNARLHVSSGHIIVETASCAELQGFIDRQIGMGYNVRVPDLTCLNIVLASIELQSTYGMNNTIITRLELFNEEMRLLANESFSVRIIKATPPLRITAFRPTTNDTWLTQRGLYEKLTSLLTVLIIPNPSHNRSIGNNDEILELNISCVTCQWKYQRFVPRVSYEFAKSGSSIGRFLGVLESLNKVLQTLEISVVSNRSSGSEMIHFHIASVPSRLVLRTGSVWSESSNVYIPFTIQSSPITWKARRTSFILQSPNNTANLRDLELTGMEDSHRLGVIIRLECTSGVAVVSMLKVKPSLVEVPCSSDQPVLSSIIDRSYVNEFLSSTFVKVQPSMNKSRVIIQLTAIDSTQESFDNAASIELHFHASSRQPETTLSPPNTSLIIHVSSKKAQPIGDLLSVHGDLTESTWFRMEARVSHGKLFIPNTVCCVDIRQTKHESELDVVGSASALKRALAATQFQSSQLFTGTDLLEVAITPFHSESNSPNVSFSVQINITVVDYAPQIQHQQELGQFSDNSYSTDLSYDSMESVLSDQSTAFANMENVKAYLATGRWADLELHESIEDSAVSSQCGETYNHQETTDLDFVLPPPVALQKSSIPTKQFNEVPVPRVVLKPSLYFSTEDAAYQFPDLAIQFDDKNDTLVSMKYSKPKQRIQLWSAELSYRPTKYGYPRSSSDDKRHRWVGDFIGKKPQFMQKLGNTFYFAASDEVHGEELWVSDGSTPGTNLLVDLEPGGEGSSPTGLVTLNGKLIFTASGLNFTTGREIWTSDGSAKNTFLVSDIRQGPKSSNPQFYTPFQTQWLLFQAETDEFGVELFKTDGTESGTAMVEDIWSGPRSSRPSSFVEWTATDGHPRIYFAATSESGRELWVSNGFSSFNTPTGTFLVRDICVGGGSSDPRYLVAISAVGLFFSASDCIHGRELWFTDGSSMGTRMVKDLNTATEQGSNPEHLVAFAGKVYFQAEADASTGRELYVSDGSAAGTVLLVDLVPGLLSSTPSLLSVVGPITLADGSTKSQGLAFTALDSNGRANIWISDGTKLGTMPLLDEIFLLSHDLRFDSALISDGKLFEFNNALYFSTHDHSSGKTIPYEERSPVYELDVQVSYGTIDVLSTVNVLQDDKFVRKSGSSTLKLKGTFFSLERDLSRLVYILPQNWNQEQFPGGHIVEWKFVVSYEKKSVESFASLVITPRVDDPVIAVPQALEDSSHYMNDYLSILRLECLPLVCDEDTPMTLDGFSVRSADGTPNQLSTTDLLKFRISVSHGAITIGEALRVNCVSKFMGPQSSKFLSFTATADCINKVLTTMTYVGVPNFSGTDQLMIRVENMREVDAAFDEVLVPIIVVERNDAPFIEVSSVYYEAEEDISLMLDSLYLRDPDSQDSTIRVTMETSYGYLTVLRHNGVKVSTVKDTTTEATILTLEGTLWNVNSAISSTVYTSAKDWNSFQFRPNDLSTMNGFDTITIHSTDFSSFNGSSVSVLYVHVEPTPDPIVIKIPTNAETSIYADDSPGNLRGDEDTWITVNGLTFSSVDDTSSMTLIVSLSVSHGILTLSDVRGLTFLDGTAQKHSTIQVKGTLANVNACVGLRYLPSKDFYGTDTLVVSAQAIDEYTQQQTPSSFIDVAITVEPVNDAPLWNIGSSTVRAIQQGQAASMKGISFQDVDVTTLNCAVDLCLMDLIVEASNGFVTMSDDFSPSFSNDFTTKKVVYAAISGTPDELNNILAAMTFELAESEYYRAGNPSRSDIKLQLILDDRGTFGKGGPQISTTTVRYNPVTWSQYEISIFAPQNVLTLDEDTIFVFDGDLQLVDPDASRSFQSLLEVTITCSYGEFALSSKSTGVQVLQNDSDGSIIIQGFLAQLNSALNGSYFIPSKDWYGSEHLSLSVVEFNRLEESREPAVASIFLFIAPVCDEPYWTTQQNTTQPLTVKEDGYLLIDTISLSNPDLQDEQGEIEVTINVNHGGVMLSMTRGLRIQQTEYSTSQDTLIAQHTPPGSSYSESRLFFKKLNFRGKVSDINSSLEGMIFKPWFNYNSNGWPVDEISLTTTSVCGISSASASTFVLQIAVIAVNDPPVLISQHFQPISLMYSSRDLNDVALYSSIEAVEDVPQKLEAMELFDPDCDLRSGDLRLLVNISCIHCTVTLDRLSETSEDQTSDDLIIVERNWRKEDGVQLIVHGALLSINIALMNQLIFQSVNNFNGYAFVLVKLSDLGNNGEGSDLHTMFVLCVDVKSVNDIPQVLLPQYQSQEPILQLDENASVLIQGAPALSTSSVPAQRDTAAWNVMRANLLAHDASTRLQSLQQFTGPEGLTVSFLVAHQGALLFAGRNSDFGQELWCSDGTAEGTVLLKDIYPGSGDSSPSYLTPFSTDNRVYFSAKGPHLSWLIKDDYQDTCQSFRQSSFNSNVYFTVAAQNVWDPKETYDCPLGFHWMSTSEAQEIFVGTIPLEGDKHEPFTYFDQCGWKGYEWGGQERKYFRFSDSLTTGAYKHAGYRDSYRVDIGFQTDLFAGIVCYREPPGYQVTWGAQLWATDGTAMGTQRVARISTSPEGSKPSHFAELNQRLYFQASSLEFGSELWSTDGTRDGTFLVADIESGSRSSEPQFLTTFDSRVFFSAQTPAYGRELWFSDGNPRFDYSIDQIATGLLIDICPGSQSSSPQHLTVLNTAGGFSLLLFQADDCIHGPELWSTDGTRIGTKLVLDIHIGSIGSFPAYMTPFEGKVYFQADDGTHGAELWTTDGSSSGTAMLVDISPGVLGSSPSFFTVLTIINDPTGVLVFTAQEQPDRLTEFWRSDGTAAGTTKVFPQSREVVQINMNSMYLQLARQKLVSIPSQPASFFFLGQETRRRLDFQREASDSVTHEEDVAHTRSITLQDAESRNENRELTMSLNCSKGWLSLGRQCDGVSLILDGALNKEKAAVVTMKGTLTALNCAVEKVTYHSKPQENGWDEIHVTLTQSVFIEEKSLDFVDDAGRDSSFTVSKRMLVKIRAINDRPTITMVLTFYAPLRQWVALRGIEIDDLDAEGGMLYVSISVRNGRIRVILDPPTTSSGPIILHAPVDGDTLQMLEFAATVKQGTTIFESLEYRCDDRYGCSNAQRDYVTVQVDDNGLTGANGPQVATKTAEILIIQEAEALA